MLFVLVICYVFLIIGLELFAVSSNEVLAKNYLQHYGCELVRHITFLVQCQLPLLQPRDSLLPAFLCGLLISPVSWPKVQQDIVQ